MRAGTGGGGGGVDPPCCTGSLGKGGGDGASMPLPHRGDTGSAPMGRVALHLEELNFLKKKQFWRVTGIEPSNLILYWSCYRTSMT